MARSGCERLSLLVTLAGLVLNLCRLPRCVATFAAAWTPRSPVHPPLEDMRPDELGRTAAASTTTPRPLGRALVNDFFAMIFFDILRRLSDRWCSSPGALHNDLLYGEGGIDRRRPARRMRS